jgi:hypothetical protein
MVDVDEVNIWACDSTSELTLLFVLLSELCLGEWFGDCFVLVIEPVVVVVVVEFGGEVGLVGSLEFELVFLILVAPDEFNTRGDVFLSKLINM